MDVIFVHVLSREHLIWTFLLQLHLDSYLLTALWLYREIKVEFTLKINLWEKGIRASIGLAEDLRKMKFLVNLISLFLLEIKIYRNLIVFAFPVSE